MKNDFCDPVRPEETRPKSRKALKIAAATFWLGPPCGYLAYFFVGFCLSALDPLSKHPDSSAIPAILLGLTGLPLVFAYFIAFKMVAIAALFAPLVDHIVPALVPRRILGMALGGFCGWVGHPPISAAIPDLQFQERATYVLASGIAGFFIAWVCQRAGWTKSTRLTSGAAE